MNKSNENINQLHEAEKRWFAIYTKYKCEKYVVDRLNKKKIEAYVPLLNTVKQYTRKTKTYQIPLMNCYAFVHITKAEYIKVLQTEYVFKFIKQRQNLIAIPSEEINLLKKIVGEFQEDLTIADHDFIEGQKVEVISGNLTGLKGVLLEQKNKNQFLVELNHIGIQLQIDINPGLLRPVHNLIRA